MFLFRMIIFGLVLCIVVIMWLCEFVRVVNFVSLVCVCFSVSLRVVLLVMFSVFE